jgi:PIN like domain
VKLLLDENVPAPWSGTKDLRLYDKAKDAGFQAVVTNDAKQMNRRLEVEAIATSGLHAFSTRTGRMDLSDSA